VKEAGYATGHFGKYINRHWGQETVPQWDRWCETDSTGQDSLISNEANVDGTVIGLPDGLPPSVWAAQRCADFVRERVASPWFAQYCPSIPHFPYTPTDRSAHLYDAARRSVPSVNEADMSDKPEWMQDLPLVNLNEAQAEYEGKMEELADLD
jgi:N-acetylglucosamine-6-sulfatase